MDDCELHDYKTVLREEGYTVLRTKSYLAAQERQRRADCQRDAAEHRADGYRVWAINCLTEERRLRDRCTFLYGAARAHGATVDELRGD